MEFTPKELLRLLSSTQRRNTPPPPTPDKYRCVVDSVPIKKHHQAGRRREG
ncbi:hypothetical protein E2C01_097895 [Portunus trituberculatus]|uniref:Uncharacterized protein n=1 Tax=Portunus trituberculatus TaxID=210409 RepID=A0A5B7KAR1_PORTR|nr:hypothetical protein [Portunus trituberculatus]